MRFDFKNVPTILYVHGNHIQSIFCQVLCMYMNTALSIVFSSTVLLFTSLVFVKIFFQFTRRIKRETFYLFSTIYIKITRWWRSLCGEEKINTLHNHVTLKNGTVVYIPRDHQPPRRHTLSLNTQKLLSISLSKPKAVSRFHEKSFLKDNIDR